MYPSTWLFPNAWFGQHELSDGNKDLGFDRGFWPTNSAGGQADFDEAVKGIIVYPERGKAK